MLRKMFARSSAHTVVGQAAVPDGVRVYAIGDIHGQAKLLDSLHQMIGDDLAAHPVLSPRSSTWAITWTVATTAKAFSIGLPPALAEALQRSC